MRNGITEPITIALIGLLSSLFTVIADKESDGALTNAIYQDSNVSECAKEYQKIIFTDEQI